MMSVKMKRGHIQSLMISFTYNFLSNMNLEDYVKEEDWQQMSGHSMFDIHFTPGAILLLDPNDAHKTGLKVDQAQDIRKIVFKVRL